MQRNDLTPEELERLEALARAATPSPWTSIPGDADSGTARGRGHVLTSTPEDWTRGVIAISHVFHERDAADWAHIAAASPDVVLALVAAARPAAAMERSEWVANNERLRAEREQVREVMGASPAEGHIEAARRVVGERDRLRAEAEQIAGTSLGAMRREVAQLRERVAALMGNLAQHRDERDRLAAELTKWQRRAEEARAEATSSLVTGFCAELAAALELPAGSAMDDIAAEVSRLAGGGWLELRHEVERLRTAMARGGGKP